MPETSHCIPWGESGDGGINSRDGAGVTGDSCRDGAGVTGVSCWGW